MYLQLFVCFIALLLYVAYSSGTKAPQDSTRYQSKLRSYINILTVILILQSALRNVAVGTDTYAYYVQYESVIDQSWYELFDAFYKTYIEGLGKDPGYAFFVKITQLIIHEYRIYLFVVAIIFFIGLAKMFKSMNLTLGGVCVAILVYEVLYYDFFSITGLRQTLATGIFFYAFPLIQKRKLIPYIFIIAIAATLHKSILILIPFYFIANYNNPRKFLAISLIALPLLFGVARTFAIYITQFQLFKSYSDYALSTYETAGAVNFMIFLIVVAIITLIVVNRNIEKSHQNIRICINGLSMAIIVLPLVWVDPSLMRVCQYFSVFSMFLLGPLILMYCSRQKINFQIVIFCMFLLFSTVIVKRGGDYAFFWQDMELPDVYKKDVRIIYT